MTTNLQNANELLDRASYLNIFVEKCFFELCKALAQISEQKAYVEAGYQTYEEYVSGELQRSPGTGSKWLKIGRWMVKENIDPKSLNTSYARIYQALNLLPEGSPEEIIAHATTLSESELISSKQEKDNPDCEHEIRICKKCRKIL